MSEVIHLFIATELNVIYDSAAQHLPRNKKILIENFWPKGFEPLKKLCNWKL